MEQQEIRVVKSAILAKKLLREGYKIVDLKPNKFNRKLSVFVFEYKECIDKLIEKYRKDMRIKREQRKNILEILN